MAGSPPLAIIYRKTAVRRVRDLSPVARRALDTILDGVARNPKFRHNNLRALKGIEGSFRLRLGGWRVTFVLDRKAGTLSVTEIEPRGKAYR